MESKIGIVVDKSLVQMTKESALNMLEVTASALKLATSLQELIVANNLDIPVVLQTDLKEYTKTYQREIYILKETD